MLDREFFNNSPLWCARALIGCELRWNTCSGLVVETEAYAAQGDEACHTFFRIGARDFVENHEAGTAYVYLNYGMHWMLNVLTKHKGNAGFVLIRALQPLEGLEEMRKRRMKIAKAAELCSGPGKLTQALAIDRRFHGYDLTKNPQFGFHSQSENFVKVIADVRVGIARATDLPWRFLQFENQHVSVAHGKVRSYLPKNRASKVQRANITTSEKPGR